MPKFTSIYVDGQLKADIERQADAEHRNLSGMVRVMVDAYLKMTPAERAEILSRKLAETYNNS